MIHKRQKNSSQLRRTRSLIAAVLVMMSTAAAQDDAPGVTAEVSPREVYEGQPVLFTLLLRNIGPVEPQLTGFDDFRVELLGDRSRNETVVLRRGNSPPTVIKRLGHEYQYQLTPIATGRLTMPPVIVEFEGRQYESEPLTINVISADDQDVIRMEVETDRASVYRAQSFKVSLFVSVKSLPGRFANQNPVSLAAMDRGRSLFGSNRMRPPHLEIPWFNDKRLSPGLESEKDWQSDIVPYGSDQLVGFRINDIPAASSFLDLIDRTFMPPPQRVQLKDATGLLTTYWQFEYSRRIVGNQPGRYTLEPCIAQGGFGVETSGNSVVVDQIFAKSNAVSIEVLEVPTSGRPANYLNASGKISSFSSDISPRTARVGDPLTLTLRLKGSGTLDEATAPNLASLPNIDKNFRLLEPTSETLNGERVFTYSLRPLTTEVTELPSIEASYFDVETEQFVPIRTTSIPIQIGESQQLNENEIVSSSPGTPVASNIELSEDGLFGNFTHVESFRHDRIQPTQWIIGWGGLLSSYAIAWFLMGRWQSSQSNPLRARRRRAVTTAEQNLATAQACIESGNVNDTNIAIRETFVGLISDITAQSAAGMTSREVLAKLAELEVPSSLATEIHALLERCDAGRYGAATTTAHEVDTAERLLERLAVELNQRGLLS